MTPTLMNVAEANHTKMAEDHGKPRGKTYRFDLSTKHNEAIDREDKEDDESEDEEVHEGEGSRAERASDDSKVGLEVHELEGAEHHEEQTVMEGTGE